ncbi:MAG: TolC family protein, partial [Nitrospinales bacterium]
MKRIFRLFIFSLVFSVLPPLDSFAEDARNRAAEISAGSAGQITLRNEDSTEPITLRQAVALALVKNPELKAFDREIRAREANIIQAGLLPNPEIEATNENFGGQRAFSGFQQTQATFALSQVILLGGKRTKRARVAALSKTLAEWDYETKRMDVLTQLSKAFTDVLGFQEQLKLMQELMRLATRVHQTVSERVKAGKVSPIEATRTQVALSSTRIDLNRAERGLKAARRRLAATWGSSNPRFEAARGDLFSIAPIPSQASLEQLISDNPDLARWITEIAQRQAVVDNEKSKAIPNLTLTGGYQRMGQTNDNAFVVGFSMPIMIFNRNQGAIQEAFSRVSKAETNQRAAKVRVSAALSQAYQALAFAHSEVTALKEQVLPSAESAFNAINEGYRFGKFPFLN